MLTGKLYLNTDRQIYFTYILTDRLYLTYILTGRLYLHTHRQTDQADRQTVPTYWQDRLHLHTDRQTVPTY